MTSVDGPVAHTTAGLERGTVVEGIAVFKQGALPTSRCAPLAADKETPCS